VPSESDLRDLLRGSDPEGRAAIDLDAVLTRARRRRRPKVIAAQALGTVAVVGALFAAVVAGQPPQQAATMIAGDAAGGSEADAAPFVDDSAASRIVEACGDAMMLHPGGSWTFTVAAATYTSDGMMTVTLDLAAASGPASGTLTARSIVLAQNGVVVAYGFPPDARPSPVRFDGETPVVVEQTFPVTSCSGKPGLDAGVYEMRPVAEFVDDLGDGFGEPIVATPVSIEIR
jgi:hypothetical protein